MHYACYSWYGTLIVWQVGNAWLKSVFHGTKQQCMLWHGNVCIIWNSDTQCVREGML